MLEQLNQSSPKKVKANVCIAGSKLKTTVRENVLTASVPAGHDLEPGMYPLEIQLGNSERRLKAGDFRVEQDQEPDSPQSD
jgi:hypothetical protein